MGAWEDNAGVEYHIVRARSVTASTVWFWCFPVCDGRMKLRS